MEKDKKPIPRGFNALPILLGLLIAVALAALRIGSVPIPVHRIVSLLAGGGSGLEYSILVDIRLPRIVLGFAVGGALSLAGVILQGLFRNSLVEPYTLGISGGAALGVCLNVVLRVHRLGIWTMPLWGFLGALSVLLLLYFIHLRKRTIRLHGLLLSGVMISFISSSLIMLILSLAPDEDRHGILFWIMGSLDEPEWRLILLAAVLTIVVLFLAFFFVHDLNAFSLGEEEARHLGIEVEKSKRRLFLLASLLTGFSVSVAGMIGFVGLLVPHFLRLWLGGDHRFLLPASVLGGGTFLIFCDTLARSLIQPKELPVGVITGLLGGGLFVYALSLKEEE
jgi:iron complex transport system permease protein